MSLEENTFKEQRSGLETFTEGSRELQSGLFDTPVSAPKSKTFIENSPTLLNEALQLALKHIGELKAKVMAMDSVIYKLQSQNESLTHSSQLKFERLNQTFQRWSEQQSRFAQDITERVGSLSTKVTERKISEEKIQNLIDRHQLVLRNFETRMLQTQKLLNEKEMQLHSTTAALDDARREIARLKRM